MVKIVGLFISQQAKTASAKIAKAVFQLKVRDLPCFNVARRL